MFRPILIIFGSASFYPYNSLSIAASIPPRSGPFNWDLTVSHYLIYSLRGGSVSLKGARSNEVSFSPPEPEPPGEAPA